MPTLEFNIEPDHSLSQTIQEDMNAECLGMDYDFDGKLIENTTKNNYASFFNFKNDNFGSIQIDDIVSNESAALVGLYSDGQYMVCSKTFNLKTKSFNNMKPREEIWNLINVACAMYLELDVDISMYDLSIK